MVRVLAWFLAGALPDSIGQLSFPSLRVGKMSTSLLDGVKVGHL